jgi:quinoprotein glucose dehydrogenase
VSFDPNLGYIFVNTQSVGQLGRLRTNPPGATGPDGQLLPPVQSQVNARYLDKQGYPCNAPPWGELTAVSTTTGDVVWRTPLGAYPELEAKGFRNYGTPNVGGSVATAGGLLFIAATMDRKFRAFDSGTGKELWSTTLEAVGNATPATYMGPDSKQYVVIYGAGAGHMRMFRGGDVFSDTFTAFTLP